MVYKIRHINDDTKIKSECAVIVGWWLIISFLQFCLFVSVKFKICERSQEEYTQIIKIGYYSCIMRDIVTMLITMYY